MLYVLKTHLKGWRSLHWMAGFCIGFAESKPSSEIACTRSRLVAKQLD